MRGRNISEFVASLDDGVEPEDPHVEHSGNWCRRFAWIPTRVEGRIVWLQTYEEMTNYFRPSDCIRRLPLAPATKDRAAPLTDRNGSL